MSGTPLQVVVVGAGLVGTRFAAELQARAGELAATTVLGAESHEPYNRVLLSDVVAGRADLAALALPAPPGTRLLRDVAAVALDRQRRTVTCDDGSVHPYDVLVLATGARARVPRVPGLAGPVAALPPGVHALRTLDDAREIVAAAANAPRAVVLGGGVLGVEVACGLAHRGLHVTLVHPGPHLMDRQLGDEAGRALATALDRLGVVVRTGAGVRSVAHDDRGVAAVALGDPRPAASAADDPVRDGAGHLPCRLLVLTAGTEPETGLAADAGLAVGRGIRVDDACATADPAVFAIGDCAEPPEGGTGLVAQGWAQARRVAAAVAATARGEQAPAAGGPEACAAAGTVDHEPSDVVRVKAHGLAVSAMGAVADAAPGSRCVRLSDPDGARHVEVLVRDGVVVGAACIGDAGVAADLVAAYTRRTPAPRDPAQLLVRPVRGAEPVTAASPTLMPDAATVCRCNGVTKGDVVAQWRSGARSVPEVVRATHATTGCGGCSEAVCGLVDWLRRSDPDPAPAQALPGPDGETAAAPSLTGRALAL